MPPKEDKRVPRGLKPKKLKTTARGDNLVAAAAALHEDDSSAVAILDSGSQGNHASRSLKLMRKDRVHRGVRLANGATEEITTAGDFSLRTVDGSGNELEPLLVQDASVLKSSPFNKFRSA